MRYGVVVAVCGEVIAMCQRLIPPPKLLLSGAFFMERINDDFKV